MRGQGTPGVTVVSVPAITVLMSQTQDFWRLFTQKNPADAGGGVLYYPILVTGSWLRAELSVGITQVLLLVCAFGRR